MKKKEFKVKIPKGYVIDEENSTFYKIVFKPVADAIDYNDVINTVGKEYSTISNDDNGVMLNITIKPHGFIMGNRNKCVRMMFRIWAYNQLLNIARYYNGDWEPNWEAENLCYHIVKSHSSIYPKGFVVLPTRILNYGTVYFKNKEDAQAVIDNPNFRRILEDYFS